MNWLDRLKPPCSPVGLVALVATVVLSVTAAAQKVVLSEYIIGPSDVLQISVFNQDKLTNKYAVASDGSFAFPYIGRVMAGGLTVRAVEDDIRDRLGKS